MTQLSIARAISLTLAVAASSLGSFVLGETDPITRDLESSATNIEDKHAPTHMETCLQDTRQVMESGEVARSIQSLMHTLAKGAEGNGEGLDLANRCHQDSASTGSSSIEEVTEPTISSASSYLCKNIDLKSIKDASHMANGSQTIPLDESCDANGGVYMESDHRLTCVSESVSENGARSQVKVIMELFNVSDCHAPACQEMESSRLFHKTMVEFQSAMEHRLASSITSDPNDTELVFVSDQNHQSAGTTSNDSNATSHRRRHWRCHMDGQYGEHPGATLEKLGGSSHTSSWMEDALTGSRVEANPTTLASTEKIIREGLSNLRNEPESSPATQSALWSASLLIAWIGYLGFWA